MPRRRVCDGTICSGRVAGPSGWGSETCRGLRNFPAAAWRSGNRYRDCRSLVGRSVNVIDMQTSLAEVFAKPKVDDQETYRKKSKRFFFEKKNQKTFRNALSSSNLIKLKVFCFFFSKKKGFFSVLAFRYISAHFQLIYNLR
jgi:hypothetical protein